MLLNWCWGRLLRVPWTARRSNQSTLKDGCSLERLMLKLKLQYLATWCGELTHLKRPGCWKWLRAGAEGDDRGWDDWMASPTQWTWVWVDSGSWWWTGRPGVLWFMGSQRVRHDSATELNWECESESCSVMSDSLGCYGLYFSLCNSPGQNTGMGSPSLLQGIFPTQDSSPGLPHCRRILY